MVLEIYILIARNCSYDILRYYDCPYRRIYIMEDQNSSIITVLHFILAVLVVI